jgi:hypothetical protein
MLFSQIQQIAQVELSVEEHPLHCRNDLQAKTSVNSQLTNCNVSHYHITYAFLL